MESVPGQNGQLDHAPENFAYPCGDYRVFRITPTDAASMEFLPQLHVRALLFLRRYGAETDPVWLTQLLYNNLRNPQTQNLVHILVAVDQRDQIVAHTISYVDSYQNLGNVVVQMQTEHDHGVPFREIHDIGLKLIEEWARSLKIKTIIAYALKRSIARLDSRDGFKEYRILLRKDLED